MIITGGMQPSDYQHIGQMRTQTLMQQFQRDEPISSGMTDYLDQHIESRDLPSGQHLFLSQVNQRPQSAMIDRFKKKSHLQQLQSLNNNYQPSSYSIVESNSMFNPMFQQDIVSNDFNQKSTQQTLNPQMMSYSKFPTKVPNIDIDETQQRKTNLVDREVQYSERSQGPVQSILGRTSVDPSQTTPYQALTYIQTPSVVEESKLATISRQIDRLAAIESYHRMNVSMAQRPSYSQHPLTQLTEKKQQFIEGRCEESSQEETTAKKPRQGREGVLHRPDHAQIIQDISGQQSPIKGAQAQYNNLNQKINVMRNLIEDLKYNEYLKRVEILNNKKAYLSTYRHVMHVNEKKLLIKEIQEMERTLENHERIMFTKDPSHQEEEPGNS